MNLLEKISSKSAKVGVLGMGYVGLPLAVEMANAGIWVVGVDLVEAKVKQLNRGVSYSRMFPPKSWPDMYRLAFCMQSLISRSSRNVMPLSSVFLRR